MWIKLDIIYPTLYRERCDINNQAQDCESACESIHIQRFKWLSFCFTCRVRYAIRNKCHYWAIWGVWMKAFHSNRAIQCKNDNILGLPQIALRRTSRHAFEGASYALTFNFNISNPQNIIIMGQLLRAWKWFYIYI